MTEAAPSTANRTLRGLRRLPNATYRVREYLTGAEVERLIEAARRRGRNGPRDLRRSCSLIGMGFAPLSFVNCAGRRLIFGTAACMSIERRAAVLAFTLYTAPSSGPCGHCRALALTSLSPKRARQQPRLGS